MNATALDGRTLLHHYTIAGKVSGIAPKWDCGLVGLGLSGNRLIGIGAKWDFGQAGPGLSGIEAKRERWTLLRHCAIRRQREGGMPMGEARRRLYGSE